MAIESKSFDLLDYEARDGGPVSVQAQWLDHKQNAYFDSI